MDNLTQFKHNIKFIYFLEKFIIRLIEKNPYTDYSIIDSTYNRICVYKEKHTLNKNIFTCNNFEELNDLLDKLEMEKFVQSYIKNNVSRKNIHLINDETISLFQEIYLLGKADVIKDYIFKKINLFSKAESFNKHIKVIIQQYQLTRNSILEKVESCSSDIIYSDSRYLLVDVVDYHASSLLGSSLWCISSSEQFFNQYLQKNQHSIFYLNKFFFLFEFENDTLIEIYGFTLSPDLTKILYIFNRLDMPLSSHSFDVINQVSGYNREFFISPSVKLLYEHNIENKKNYHNPIDIQKETRDLLRLGIKSNEYFKIDSLEDLNNFDFDNFSLESLFLLEFKNSNLFYESLNSLAIDIESINIQKIFKSFFSFSFSNKKPLFFYRQLGWILNKKQSFVNEKRSSSFENTLFKIIKKSPIEIFYEDGLKYQEDKFLTLKNPKNIKFFNSNYQPISIYKTIQFLTSDYSNFNNFQSLDLVGDFFWISSSLSFINDYIENNYVNNDYSFLLNFSDFFNTVKHNTREVFLFKQSIFIINTLKKQGKIFILDNDKKH